MVTGPKSRLARGEARQGKPIKRAAEMRPKSFIVIQCEICFGGWLLAGQVAFPLRIWIVVLSHLAISTPRIPERSSMIPEGGRPRTVSA